MAETLRYADIVGLMAAIHREKVAARSINVLLQMFEALIHRHEYQMPERIP
jgi:hypothetical protein